MSGQEKLLIIAMVVSILVILGLVIVFSFLFFLYSFYKVKHINFGFEDASLKKEVLENTYKINKKRQKKNKMPFLTYKEMLSYEKETNKCLHLAMNIFSSLIIIVLLGVFSVGLIYRVNNDNLYINNVTYLTILTPSMEEKNEENDYLDLHDLNNQITQYSLVGIEKLNNEEDIKLYDVLAYKHEDMIILHRVVEIKVDEKSNDTIYVLKGDANPSSLSYETSLKYEDFIGRYNGFNSYFLGVFLTYIKSSIGIIALIGAAIFLFLADFAECRISSSYDKRILYLIDKIEIKDCYNISDLSKCDSIEVNNNYLINDSIYYYLDKISENRYIDEEINNDNDKKENKNSKKKFLNCFKKRNKENNKDSNDKKE